MAQNVYPTSDVTNEWASGGFADIDEGATPNDSDFAYSIDKPTDDIFEVHLGDPGDPAIGTGHIIRYHWATVDGGVLSGDGTAVTQTYNLYQGTTLISTGTGNTHTTNNATWQTASFTLSTAEADNITDYTDLRLRVVASGGGGSPADRRGAAVSWAELETPDASSGQTVTPGPVTFSSSVPAPTEIHLVTDVVAAIVLVTAVAGTTAVIHDVDPVTFATNVPVATPSLGTTLKPPPVTFASGVPAVTETHVITRNATPVGLVSSVPVARASAIVTPGPVTFSSTNILGLWCLMYLQQ